MTMPEEPIKSKNHDKNEAKRLAKLAKFEAKQAKQAAEAVRHSISYSDQVK